MVTASPACIEPLSPFVSRSAEDSGVIDDALLNPSPNDVLLVELLRSPGRIAERILDPQRLLPLITTSMTFVMVTSAIFTFVAAPGSEWLLAGQSALSSALAFVTATAAAMAPIYGAALLLRARLPMAKLAAALAASTATAGLLLAAASPFVMTLLRSDRDWCGPLSVVFAYLFAGLAGGSRLHALLTQIATRTMGCEALDPADAARVGVLSRVSLMVLWFTLSLALWAFNVLGTR